VIRHATNQDIPELVEVMRNFYRESGYASRVEYDPISAADTFAALIEDNNGCLIVAEQDGELVGSIGALAFPLYFNKSYRMAQELFWWLSPKLRGSSIGIRLLRKAEQWAKLNRVENFIMIALDKVNPDKVGSLYKRSGYELSEYLYMKAI